MRVRDRAVKTGRRPGVTELLAASGLPRVLGIEFPGPARGIRCQRREALVAQATRLGRLIGAMGHDQPTPLPRLLASSFAADRRQVIEDDRQRLNDQGPQPTGERLVHPVGVLRQRIHRVQEGLVRHRLGADLGNPGPLQSAQDAELGFRVTQPVEDPHPQQLFGVELPAVAQQPTKDLGES